MRAHLTWSLNRTFSRKAIETLSQLATDNRAPLWSLNRTFSRKAIETRNNRKDRSVRIIAALNRTFSRKAIETSAWWGRCCPARAGLSIEHSAERQLRLVASQLFTSTITETLNRTFSRKAIETPPMRWHRPSGRPPLNRTFSRKAIETFVIVMRYSPVSPGLSIEHSAERQLRRREERHRGFLRSTGSLNRTFSRKAIETGPPRRQTASRSRRLSIEHSAERQLRLNWI